MKGKKRKGKEKTNKEIAIPLCPISICDIYFVMLMLMWQRGLKMAYGTTQDKLSVSLILSERLSEVSESLCA